MCFRVHWAFERAGLCHVKSVHNDESVEHIGDGAFENCMSLETLEFREHVEFCQ